MQTYIGNIMSVHIGNSYMFMNLSHSVSIFMLELLLEAHLKQTQHNGLRNVCQTNNMTSLTAGHFTLSDISGTQQFENILTDRDKYVEKCSSYCGGFVMFF